MTDKSKNSRAEAILASLVEHYIYHGQPIGSKTLAEVTHLGLSSASIRNIMADLEGAGYLLQPHTSAGRIPTALAYRFFVDSLLTVKSVDRDELLELQLQFSHSETTQNLMKHTTSVLSGLTHLAGIVSVPKLQSLTLRQIEFLPLTDKRVLVILVVNEKDVQNRIIQTDRQYTSSELEVATNFLNAHFAGKELDEIQRELLAEMTKEKSSLDQYMQTILDITAKTLETTQSEEDEYIVAGESNLLSGSNPANLQHLKGLFDAFTQKRDIVHLLEQSVRAEGVQIFIGEESGCDAFGEFSVVTSPYRANGKVMGVLGVIGPTRMHYEKVIPLVDVTAKLLSSALEEK